MRILWCIRFGGAKSMGVASKYEIKLLTEWIYLLGTYLEYNMKIKIF